MRLVILYRHLDAVYVYEREDIYRIIKSSIRVVSDQVCAFW